MDSIDAVQMAVERYMLEFFEAARGFPNEYATLSDHSANSADKVRLAYREIENSILALEDVAVSREEQEKTMLNLQTEYDNIKREVLSIESTLRSLDESNDARILQLLQMLRERNNS